MAVNKGDERYWEHYSPTAVDQVSQAAAGDREIAYANGFGLGFAQALRDMRADGDGAQKANPGFYRQMDDKAAAYRAGADCLRGLQKTVASLAQTLAGVWDGDDAETAQKALQRLHGTAGHLADVCGRLDTACQKASANMDMIVENFPYGAWDKWSSTERREHNDAIWSWVASAYESMVTGSYTRIRRTYTPINSYSDQTVEDVHADRNAARGEYHDDVQHTTLYPGLPKAVGANLPVLAEKYDPGSGPSFTAPSPPDLPTPPAFTPPPGVYEPPTRDSLAGLSGVGDGLGGPGGGPGLGGSGPEAGPHGFGPTGGGTDGRGPGGLGPGMFPGGAGAAGRGRAGGIGRGGGPGMLGGAGAGAGHGEGDEHQTWLTEDDDVWGLNSAQALPSHLISGEN